LIGDLTIKELLTETNRSSYKLLDSNLNTMINEGGETISIYFPYSLLRKIDEACKKDRRSRSSYVVIILEEHLKKLEEEQKPSRPLIRV